MATVGVVWKSLNKADRFIFIRGCQPYEDPPVSKDQQRFSEWEGKLCEKCLGYKHILHFGKLLCPPGRAWSICCILTIFRTFHTSQLWMQFRYGSNFAERLWKIHLKKMEDIPISQSELCCTVLKLKLWPFPPPLVLNNVPKYMAISKNHLPISLSSGLVLINTYTMANDDKL